MRVFWNLDSGIWTLVSLADSMESLGWGVDVYGSCTGGMLLGGVRNLEHPFLSTGESLSDSPQELNYRLGLEIFSVPVSF